MNKPDRLIKFNTTTGPLYIDLEEVETVIAPDGSTMVVGFKSGRSLHMNRTFFDDMARIMDAWMEWKNRQ